MNGKTRDYLESALLYVGCAGVCLLVSGQSLVAWVLAALFVLLALASLVGAVFAMLEGPDPEDAYFKGGLDSRRQGPGGFKRAGDQQ